MSKTQRAASLWLVIHLLAWVGLGLAAYLTYIHVGVHTNPSFTSSCNINQTFNCESVALSSYAVMAGLPTAVWGLIGYLFVLVISLLGWRRQGTGASPLHGMLVLLTFCCLVAGVSFAYISYAKIKAFCPHCMGTYVINIALFVIAMMALSKDGVSVGDGISAFLGWLPRNLILLFIPLFLLVVVVLGYPKYWHAQWKGMSLPTSICGAAMSDSTMAHGEDDGIHWIGAKNPKLRIVEFADYECPFCNRAHFEMRALLRKCPRAVRLYHRHYPLDHKCNPRINRPFHKRACLLAKAAYCSGKQGKFWVANDFLYTKGKKLDAKELVQAMTRLGLNGDKLHSCIQSSEAKAELDKDMQAGRDLRMQGTPFFTMNGVAYRKGYIPKESILKALQASQKTVTARKTPEKRVTPRKRGSQGNTVPVRMETPKPPTFRPLAPPRPTAPTPRR